MNRWNQLFLATVLLFAVGCSSTNNSIESAQFHLDQGQYTEAIDILQEVVDNDAANYKATGLLASAYFGRGFLGQDGSYLQVLSKFLEGQGSGQSNMQSVEAATPSAAAAGEADIFKSVDLLAAIPATDRTQENYLLKATAELATISVVGVVKIGALTTDDPCALDISSVNSDENARFNDALDNVVGDFEGAGIEDFSTTELGTQLIQMKSDLQAAADLATYLQNEFGTTTCP